MPGQPFVQIDAFTRESFGGNPAAVFLLPSGRDEGWMQRVAREMNQADTAFLVRRDDEFDLRWFTPTVEVELCGHATLASAHMLWESGVLPSGATARFRTRSGLLTARLHDDRIWLDLPAASLRAEPAVPALPVPSVPSRSAPGERRSTFWSSCPTSAPSERSAPTCRASRRSRLEA